MVWIDLAHDRIQQQVLVNAVMNTGVTINVWILLASDNQVFRKDSVSVKFVM